MVKTRGLKYQGVILVLSNNHEDYAYDLRWSHQSQGPIEEKSGRRFGLDENGLKRGKKAAPPGI